MRRIVPRAIHNLLVTLVTIYDVAKMAESPVKNAALADLDLLANVVEFKERFYPRGWARYDLARPGSFRLVPEGHVLAAVLADYRAMANMILGTCRSSMQS